LNYYVGIREVNVCTVKVSLTKEEEQLPEDEKKFLIKKQALEHRAEGSELIIEYSHDLPKEMWSVELES